MKGFLEKFFPDILTRETSQVGDLYCTYDDQRIQWFTSSLFLAGAITEVSGTTGGCHVGATWERLLKVGYLNFKT